MGVPISQGSGSITRSKEEAGNYQKLRKGLVYVRAFEAGEILQESDIFHARPVLYFSCNDLSTVVGSRLLKSVMKGDMIESDDLK